MNSLYVRYKNLNFNQLYYTFLSTEGTSKYFK